MKLFYKAPVAALAVVMVLGLVGPTTTLAVTPPDRTFGITDTYSVYGHAGITNANAGTRVWGNVGDNNAGHAGFTATQVPSGIIDTTTASGTAIENDASSVYDSLMDASQGGSTGLDLAGTHTIANGNPITPGVYTVGATTLNGTVELSGAGVYIFRSDSSSTIATSGGTMILSNGATACNVFWAIPASMTIGTGSHMVGTIIAHTGLISLGTSASLVGRAISLIAQVTLDNNQITQPTCTAATPTPAGGIRRDSTITVVKTVINDNGRTKMIADFPLFLNGVPVISGVSTNFPAPLGGTYTVTETSDSQYTRTFSGDCDVNGQVTLSSGQNRFCIMTNNDIGALAVPPVPPLIDVVKVPSPLALPGGPGPVTYTYTLRNIGTVPVTNVTMVGDTCSPITLVSGDTNGDSKLDTTETWVYTCSTTLTATHTNTVVATGWANGISAVDIASATVVVGAPIVPPLIHVTKVPDPLALHAGGGMVTYTERITNPGTVALSGVGLRDDKCNPVTYISGDTNRDSLLQPGETWTYTCRTNLTTSTTNTAVASGTANGITVRDFAIATVVVAAPGLPHAGFPPAGNGIPWNLIAICSGILVAVSTLLSVVLRRRTV